MGTGWADAAGAAAASGDHILFLRPDTLPEPGALSMLHAIALASKAGAVTDLIAELTLAKTTEVNAESLAYTIHAHPTFAEAIKEATEDALGHPIHL